MNLNDLSHEVIGAAIEVHRNLGPGLLESVYQSCLFVELQNRKISFKAQAVVPIQYKGKLIEKDFILDFLIEESLVVELKSLEVVLPVHKAQLLTYLRLTNKSLGLLINFNEVLLTNGITRIVNNFKE